MIDCLVKSEENVRVKIHPILNGLDDKQWYTFGEDVPKKREELTHWIEEEKKKGKSSLEISTELKQWSDAKTNEVNPMEMDKVTRYLVNLVEYSRYFEVFEHFVSIRTQLSDQFSTIAEEEGYEIFRPIHNMLMNIKDASVFAKDEQDLNRIE